MEERWIRSSRCFPEEVARRGEPELRPEAGHIIASRTPEMEAMRNRLFGRASLATVHPGRWPPPTSVAADDLIQAIRQHCGLVGQIQASVSQPPDHFLLTVQSGDECTSVVMQSTLVCLHGCAVSFCRWSHAYGGDKSELPFITVLSIDGLPEDARELTFIKNVVNGLGGEFVKFETPVDRRSIRFRAWMRNPSSIPKKLKIEIPETVRQPTLPIEEEEEEELLINELTETPVERLSKRNLIFEVLIHVHEVIDQFPLITDGPTAVDIDSSSETDQDFTDYGESPGVKDVTRRHEFPCFVNTVDGSIPPNKGIDPC